MPERPDFPVITGPTATGKTALAVALAQRLPGEVVGADSMQIYRGMDIGTAKPDASEQAAARHHMIDIADPAQNYSAARYAADAAACVEDIRGRGLTPIVAGGTGLYIEGLLRGTDYAAAPGDTGVRARLEAEYDALGGDAFREKLAAVDPERAAKLAPGDRKRLVRALEVWTLTGIPLTEHDRRSRETPPRYRAVIYALDYTDRAALYARIDSRAAGMFRAGLVDEVRALLAQGIPMDGTAMQAIGYSQCVSYLRGACTLDEAIADVQLRSRQYAKRQLTWLRRNPSVVWLRWDSTPTDRDIAALADRIAAAWGR